MNGSSANAKLAITLAREKGYSGEELEDYEKRLKLFESQTAYREKWTEPDAGEG